MECCRLPVFQRGAWAVHCEAGLDLKKLVYLEGKATVAQLETAGVLERVRVSVVTVDNEQFAAWCPLPAETKVRAERVRV